MNVSRTFSFATIWKKGLSDLQSGYRHLLLSTKEKHQDERGYERKDISVFNLETVLCIFSEIKDILYQ